jgi:hypothetical protein
MDEGLASGGVFAEFVNDPASGACVGTQTPTIVEAERDEIESASGIAFGGQANIFAAKFGHGH